MPPVLVQGPTLMGTLAGSALSGTLGAAPTNGNTLFLVAANSLSGAVSPDLISSIVQTGVTWTHQIDNNDGILNVLSVEIWKGVPGAGAGTGITINYSSNPTAAQAYVTEYSGLPNALLDKTAINSNGVQSFTGDSGTTANTTSATEVWVAGISSTTQQSAPTNGFSITFSQPVGYYDKIVSSIGTANVSCTLGGKSGSAYAGCIATFKSGITTTTSSIDVDFVMAYESVSGS